LVLGDLSGRTPHLDQVVQVAVARAHLLLAGLPAHLHPDTDGDTDGHHHERDAEQDQQLLAAGHEVGGHAHA
jgi:hypothetical protein